MNPHSDADAPSVQPDCALPTGEDPDARRFGGIGRLYGTGVQARFRAARVAVVGLGGVGSWAAEALARSGFADITLVDLDHIAESNTNRQVHALEGAYGRSKVAAMADRLRAIHPGAFVREIDDFVTGANCAALLAGTQIVIDCIDDARAKAAMIAWGRSTGCVVITCGASGGRVDPSRIRVTDLGLVTGDPLLARVRHRLRKEHGYRAARADHRPGKMGCEAVSSDEPIRGGSSLPVAPGGGAPGAPLACAGYGSCVTVTATMGLVAASRALAWLDALAAAPQVPPPPG